MSSDLDTFELALLAELRSHVQSGAATQPDRVPPRGWLRIAGPIAAAALLAVSVATGMFGQQASPAYSLERLDSGDIVVRVHRLSDEEGLEESLRRLGVTADVTYAPKATSPSDLEQFAAPGCPGVRAVTLDPAEDGELVFTVEFEQAARPGSVLHIAAAGDTEPGGWSAVAVRWQGAACKT